jgi:hypothetical protein
MANAAFTNDEIQAAIQDLGFDLTIVTIEAVKALLSLHDFCPVAGIVCKKCEFPINMIEGSLVVGMNAHIRSKHNENYLKWKEWRQQKKVFVNLFESKMREIALRVIKATDDESKTNVILECMDPKLLHRYCNHET